MGNGKAGRSFKNCLQSSVLWAPLGVQGSSQFLSTVLVEHPNVLSEDKNRRLAEQSENIARGGVLHPKRQLNPSPDLQELVSIKKGNTD
mmetsp:Transcript_16964/g.69204  ORF Transcript_16964/g.69204 Transcript_16964/m.69204 type:complete len:89 (+) Transcript_16964:580-846(+)